MNIPTTKQSAIEAMEVFLTAADPADTLRVSDAGRVYTANPVVVLFGRVQSAVLQRLGKNGTAVDWQEKARQAVLDTLKRDVELVSGTVSSSDQDRIEELLTDISTPKEGSPQANLRSRLPGKIAALKAHSDTSKLASALEKLEFFSRPVNAPLLPHLRLHMKGGASLSESLKAGLQSHLVNGLGLSAETAKNASDNIHWAMTNFGCDFKEALDIACCAGDMVKQKQCARQYDPAMLLALVRVRYRISLEDARAVLDKFNHLISEALPAGWTDNWELMPDGSRRLINVDAFQKKYLSYFKDSLTEGGIDPTSGLSTSFHRDAGRTHFRFGTGPDAVKVDTDLNQAIKVLTEFVPDPAIRRSLSRCLSQGGHNGLKGSMAESLATDVHSFFYIFEIEPDPAPDSEYARSTNVISVQLTEEGRIRVGYAIYMKHFRLEHPANRIPMKINSRYDSRTPASQTDHTAVARSVVEFDMEQLRQGIIAPIFVRDPELRLTIEPDRPRIFLKVIDSLLEQQ